MIEITRNNAITKSGFCLLLLPELLVSYAHIKNYKCIFLNIGWLFWGINIRYEKEIENSDKDS